MVVSMLFVVSVLGSGAYAAEDGTEDNVKGMLDSIPEIVAPVDPKAEEEKPVQVQGLDYDGYLKECQKVVYPYFKAPKSVVKEFPKVEVTFVVQVDETGMIIGVAAPQRSGFNNFDAAALKALNKVGRLPVPPQGWNTEIDKVLIPFTAKSGK